MNLQFLGDALDHWKGALFGWLLTNRVLRDFAVEPMFTDQPLWRSEDLLTYSRLLKVTPSQIITHHESLQNRAVYFAEISHRGDLFLDPDIGIATGRISSRHISFSEIEKLLDAAPQRLLVTYQHIRGQLAAARIDTIMMMLERKIGSSAWCTYESGNVAALFLSRDSCRLVEVAGSFALMLGRCAELRVRRSSNVRLQSDAEGSLVGMPGS